MVAFLFDMSAYSYDQGLRALGLMYEAARGALEEQRRDFDSAIREYQEHLDSGGDPIGEWDADGNKLSEQDQVYRLHQLNIDDASEELKAATVIAIYHHWERHIPALKTANTTGHNNLIKLASKLEVPLHPDIDALYNCGIYFKHGNDEKRTKMLTEWPNRFQTSRQTCQPLTWHRNLTFDHTVIDWFLEIAAFSKRPITNFDSPK